MEQKIAFAAKNFNTAPTKEGQLQAARAYIADVIHAYYGQWGFPMASSVLIPRVKALYAPLATAAELTAYLVDTKTIQIVLDMAGRRYVMPGDVEVTRDQINDMMWELASRKRGKR